MILEATADKLVVVSDLHIGSPASQAWRSFPAFVDHVEALGADLCINGDGFDLLQSTFARLVAAALPVIRRLSSFIEKGHSLYYTVGNHDLAIEHLLHVLPLTVSPFLNVTSGDCRIRIEHGHVYEPFYARHPQLYEFGGRTASGFLVANADTYKVWSNMQAVVDRRRRRDVADYPHYQAAAALYERGFDAVILGHTHHAEYSVLDDGLFVNTGDGMTNGDYVVIDDGMLELHRWR